MIQETADEFAERFQIEVGSVSDARIQGLHEQAFMQALAYANVGQIVACSKKVQMFQALLDSPEVRTGLEQAFLSNIANQGFEEALELVTNNLVRPEFVRSEQVRELARLQVFPLLVRGEYEKILMLNTQLSLGLTTELVIGYDPTREHFFERLDAEFPTLAAKCRGSLPALFSLWPHIQLLDDELLRTTPFLAEALQANERFGAKLLTKYTSLDKLSQKNIATLYEHKADILREGHVTDPESRGFRIAMQHRLEGYRRNTEIASALRKAGIDVEAWLNHEDDSYFTLGKDENLRFSDTIVTPIERTQVTIEK